jgi:hypothetical protein
MFTAELRCAEPSASSFVTDDVSHAQGAQSCGGAIVLGSHYDTVLDAGKYDGALGIVTAIAAVKSFLRTNPKPKCPVRPCRVMSASSVFKQLIC